MDLINLLSSYGLEKNEALLYLVALRTGPTTVANLSKESKLNRTTCYKFIDSLMAKGLMSSYVDGMRRKYLAGDPDNLLILVENKKIYLDTQKKNLQAILPKLRSLVKDLPETTTIKRYKGNEEVLLALHLESEIPTGPILLGFDVENADRYFTAELKQEILNRRLRQKKEIEILYSAKTELEPRSLAKLHRLKTINKKFDSDITIYGNKVRFISFSGKLEAIVIENKQIANTLRLLFELAVKSQE